MKNYNFLIFFILCVFSLAIIIPILATNTTNTPQSIQIQSTVLAQAYYIEHNGIKIYVCESFVKNNVSLSYWDDNVHDERMATKNQRESLLVKLKGIKGITKAVLQYRNQYVLTISNEDWEIHKNEILEAFTT